MLESHAPELRAWLSREGTERVELSFERLDPGAGHDQAATGDTRGQERREGGRRSAAAPLVTPAAAGDLAEALAHTSSQTTGVDLVA